MTDIFDPLILASATKHSVPFGLLKAVIEHESNFDPNAVGDGGLSVGLCQMHPDACETVGADWTKMKDPATAIDAGAAYLRWNFDRFFDWRWALAAYNRGPTVMMAGRRYADLVLQLRIIIDAQPQPPVAS